LSRFTGRTPEPEALATSIGVGRLVLSGALFAAPTASARVLGVDSASAKRMAFLARMAAVRDMGIGIGTLASRGTPQVSLWLAVGAVADAVDAVVVAGATKHGVTRGLAAVGTVVGAAGVAAAGGWAAIQLKGRP
jgi:hypothetical protein